MLIGTYRHSLDTKKRMRLPSKLKAELGSSLVITKGLNQNLYIFSSADFETLYSKLKSVALFDEEAQRPVRKFLSSAFDVSEDSQGRFLLPTELCNYAGLSKDIVIVGAGSRLEIWSEENWNKVEAEETNFDKLGSLGV